MSYRIQTGEPLTKAFRRIATDQLDRALAEMNSRRGNSAEGLHSIRLRFKKLRSLLRLFRTSIEGSYRTLNAEFRDAGRAFAAAREADVLKRTAARIRSAAGQSNGVVISPVLRSALRSQKTSDRPGPARGGGEDIRRRLKNCRKALSRVSIRSEDGIAVGLKASYRAGRDSWRNSRHARGDERLHEMRKRCKDLGYQLRLLRDDGQKMLDAQIDLLRDLADRLGDDHDLAMLAAAVRRTREFQQKDKRCDLVLKRIADARAGLQKEADRLGRMIYAEKPKAFASRISHYWAAARLKT